jgi:uncharacterized membrane protein
MVGFGPVLVNETPELLSQIDDFKDAASLVGDDDPRLFFLVDYDDTRQSRQHDGAQGCTRRQHGSFMGSLVGLLFLNPLAGLVIGAGTGALSGSLTDYGINDDFVRKLGETIPVDSSALFVLVKSVTEDKVLAEIEHYKPRVLKTSLSNEDEAKLKAALSKAA